MMLIHSRHSRAHHRKDQIDTAREKLTAHIAAPTQPKPSEVKRRSTSIVLGTRGRLEQLHSATSTESEIKNLGTYRPGALALAAAPKPKAYINLREQKQWKPNGNLATINSALVTPVTVTSRPHEKQLIYHELATFLMHKPGSPTGATAACGLWL